MTLRTLMQAGPAKANDLFTRLAETSDGALKTREGVVQNPVFLGYITRAETAGL